jgi:GT2 family glycosyltransferase
MTNLVRLQTVLVPETSFCQEKTVYFHVNDDESVIDFDGYFNLFYIEKHRKYSDINGLVLHLELRGYEKLILMHDRQAIAEYELENPSEIVICDYEFPYEQYDNGVFYFRLIRALGDTKAHVSGCYLGCAKEIRPANVFVDICTYKREPYVIRNMKRLTEFLDNEEKSGGDVKGNLHVGIIDNGRTLSGNAEMTELIASNPYIKVYPNPNTGGAGGFTRGMKEALLQKKELGLTHVLLMDDDASFDTEMFVRLFGILRTLKEEYKDLTIGGALYREDFPFIQFASGEWFERFESINEMQNLDLRSYDECTRKEMCSTDGNGRSYSGWWCCCYSLDVVAEDNLPIPMFVHRDDIEYEVRCREMGNRITFINGIGVWHKAFDSEFAGSKIYYDVRNSLIYSKIHEPEAVDWFFNVKLRKLMTGFLFNNRYPDMYLTYHGAMDFLKGKEWFDALDPEKNHKRVAEIAKKHSKYITLDELEKYGCENARAKAQDYIENGSSLDDILSDRNHQARKVPFIEKLTLNGQFLPAKKGAAVIIPYNKLWDTGYRYKKYLFVAKGNPGILYVRTNPLEAFNMVRMYLRVRSAYRQFYKANMKL